MEIVPLVQLSLGIFTGLLALVLLISYISFKLNKKSNSKPSDDIARQVDPQILHLVNSGMINQPNYDNHPKAAPQYYSLQDYAPLQKTDSEMREKREYKKTVKFTVLNDLPSANPGYAPETTASFSHKFAASKSKDAFAMFK